MNEIKVPTAIKEINSPINYRQVWHFLTDKGIELYGPKFHLYEDDADIIVKLIAWFAKDTEQAEKSSIDLSKGIMLTGPVGCGKTSLMSVCRFLLPADKRHCIKSCRDVSFEFAEKGHEIFHKYTRGSFSQHKFEPRTYCFDDLGLESLMNFYGNQCSVMAEILLSRYDMFHSFGMMTHLTTNLNSQDIEERYGLRVRSRMREMFNVLAFVTPSHDKR